MEHRQTRMRRAVPWLCTLAFLALGCRQAVPETKPAARPQRIVSLTLGTDEILPELVPIERFVAVTHLVDDKQSSNVQGVYPKTVARINGKDVEQIVQLSPDLVCVATYNSPSLLHALKNAGLAMHTNEGLNSFAGIERAIKALGDRVGEPAKGEELAKRFADRRQEIARRVQDAKSKPRVLYWFSGSTAGTDTTINDVIVTAGGTNVAAELKIEGNREISPEQVIEADPAYVLMSRWDANPEQHGLDRHPILKNLRAVREGRVITVDQRYLSSVSHHVLDGVDMLARKLHPDCFSEKAP